jgi:hypothetical protein
VGDPIRGSPEKRRSLLERKCHAKRKENRSFFNQIKIVRDFLTNI